MLNVRIHHEYPETDDVMAFEPEHGILILFFSVLIITCT